MCPSAHSSPGGIDSSTVVSFLSESVPSGLQTFALGYREASFSEFEHARKVADHFQTQHWELLIKPVDAARDRARRVAPR